MTDPGRGSGARTAVADDLDAVFAMASALATTAVPGREAFDAAIDWIGSDPRHTLLVVGPAGAPTGYLLGSVHPTFHADGPVGWVEEIYVAEHRRGHGDGRCLMTAFRSWAESFEVAYVAVATRRAAGFYASLGYEASATYFRTPPST